MTNIPQDKTIKIRKTTHKRIVKMGTTEDTINDVVVMLLDYWDEGHKQAKKK